MINLEVSGFRQARSLALLAALATVVALALVAPAQAAFPGANGKIAFESDRDGDLEIYTVNPDGSGETKVTNNSCHDFDPTWSPDGTQLLYQPCGGNPHEPAWSPDGSRIAYSHLDWVEVCGEEECTFISAHRIYTAAADRTGDAPIPGTEQGADTQSYPAWSVDGRIAFTGEYWYCDDSGLHFECLGPADGEVFVTHPNGTGFHFVAPGYRPDWSPYGVSNLLYWNGGIRKVNADGTGDGPVGVNGFAPVWAPNKTRIAYWATAGSGLEVRTAKPDGTDVTTVAEGTDPDWQPLPIGGDLSITQADSLDPIQAGQPFHYTLTVTNGSALPKADVVATDRLPPSVHFDGATPSQGSCSQALGELSCALGTLAGGQSATVEVDLRAKRARPLTNTAWAAAPEGDLARSTETTSVSELHPRYPRPGGAAILRVPLVPAYFQCTTAADTQHAVPLDLPSCSKRQFEPQGQPESTLVGMSASGAGSASVKLVVKLGIDQTPEDEADVNITASAGDVLCVMWPPSPDYCIAGAGSRDYIGPLLLTATMRITDLANGDFAGDPGTVQDFDLDIPLACSATASNTVGATCAISTSADALVPGIVQEEKRTVIAARSIRIQDPGPDYAVSPPGCPPTCGTGDEKNFLMQGLFAP